MRYFCVYYGQNLIILEEFVDGKSEKLSSDLSQKDFIRIRSSKTLEELVVIALEVMRRMPPPISWVSGPITSGGRTPEENRRRLKSVILNLKRNGEAVFNYLPFEKQAEKILRRQFGKGRLPGVAQHKLLNEFYAPVFGSGYIKKLRLLPRWDSSCNAMWKHAFAKARGIPIVYVPKELVRG